MSLLKSLKAFNSRHSPSTLFMFYTGLAIIAFILLLITLGQYIYPRSPLETGSDPLVPPHAGYPMGTDNIGRDVLSRVIAGGKSSIMVALIAMGTSLSVGIPLGVLSGYIGGKSDSLLVLIMDAIYAFPVYITALLIAIALGPQPENISIAVGTAYIPQYFRLVRSIALSIKEKPFIEAEKSIGAGTIFIVYHHVLPYTVSSILVLVSMGIADSVMTVSGLGFLGLGIQPPTPEWGTDLRWGRDVFLTGKWWVVFFPGLMIFLTVAGFNLLSEGVNAVFQERGGSRIVGS